MMDGSSTAARNGSYDKGAGWQRGARQTEGGRGPVALTLSVSVPVVCLEWFLGESCTGQKGNFFFFTVLVRVWWFYLKTFPDDGHEPVVYWEWIGENESSVTAVNALQPLKSVGTHEWTGRILMCDKCYDDTMYVRLIERSREKRLPMSWTHLNDIVDYWIPKRPIQP